MRPARENAGPPVMGIVLPVSKMSICQTIFYPQNTHQLLFGINDFIDTKRRGASSARFGCFLARSRTRSPCYPCVPGEGSLGVAIGGVGGRHIWHCRLSRRTIQNGMETEVRSSSIMWRRVLRIPARRLPAMVPSTGRSSAFASAAVKSARDQMNGLPPVTATVVPDV